MATSKLVKTNEKIAEALTEVFFNIEHSVVDRYTKIEDTFVETYLAKEGETTEAKERLLQERAQRKQAQREG